MRALGIVIPAPCFIESFNGRLRDELLNETLFRSLPDARVALNTRKLRPPFAGVFNLAAVLRGLARSLI